MTAIELFEQVKALQDEVRETRIYIVGKRESVPDLILGRAGVMDTVATEVESHLCRAAIEIGLAFQAARRARDEAAEKTPA